MHVVLISACTKKALKRSRTVLDSYAQRAGEAVWMTPISEAGLVELRMLLRRSATKNTAVACYRNDGRKRMRLLWVVGNARRFGPHGVFPVASQTRRESPYPPWAKTAALLAQGAGWLHDLGKFGRVFQDKLKAAGRYADPVRHEWLSQLIARRLSEGADWAQAWAADNRDYADNAPFARQLDSAEAVLWFLVATHHRLPGVQGERCQNVSIGTKAYVREKNHLPQPLCAPQPATLEAIRRHLAKVAALPACDDLHYWRGLALFARMALILADHSVSAQTQRAPDALAFANTTRPDGQLNQALDWHLEQVARRAGELLFKMLALAPPALSPSTVDAIRCRATGNFAWQERAARALAGGAERHACPHLVFNMAGTGSGKTRMNLRALCELGQGRPLRAAVALNLRTLTLQSGAAYAEIGVAADEMACVVGDKLARALFAYQRSQAQERFADDDENPPEEAFSALGDFEYAEAPSWLAEFTARQPHAGKVIGAPLLVSTVDFLVAAGEPNRQAHHALAALRLMSSDLILDEIDGYDPRALLAVCRLVSMAAWFGRNVVVSSGTLSRPVALAVWRSFRHGAAMRAALAGGNGEFVTHAIDELCPAGALNRPDEAAFTAFYQQRIDALLAALDKGERYRIPYLQEVAPPAWTGFSDAVACAARRLHGDHHLRDPQSGKRVSFGLVRVANIGTAVRLAKALCGALGEARVTCYHAQHLPLRRFFIESRLDFLLTRKHGDAHLFSDPQIRSMIDAAPGDEVLFVVVATPVEEIGRDHDFDWAVIEPSSAQSIVQTAGRVNRHRLRAIDAPNVAVLRFNARYVEGGKQGQAVFRQPGLECADYPYPSHDLQELFDWSRLAVKLDAAARFADHPFATHDDASLERAIAKWLERYLGEGKAEHMWMCEDVYTCARLRETHGELEAELRDPARPNLMWVRDATLSEAKDRVINVEPASDGDWLYRDDEQLVELAESAGVDTRAGLTINLPCYRTQNNAKEPCAVQEFSKFRRHLSFGFYRD